MSTLAQARLGDHTDAVQERLETLERDRVVERIWSHDASLWSWDAKAQKAVQNRLGWLAAPEAACREAETFTAFGDEVRREGFLHVLLVGMGGSSLCPEVLRRTFPAGPDSPRLTVLDSTAPEAILAAERSLPLDQTLFVVSTKSGTTVETLSLYRYFWEVARAARGQEPGEAFVAVTDPATPLQKEAKKRAFRRVFPGPPTVGGRYSALTAFGLVPAATLGIDLERYLGSATRAADACRRPGAENPGLVLGAILGTLALAGRDKVTLVADPPVQSVGLWLEQLLAESLGKEGKGVVPVAEEPLGSPGVYGDDRLFVYLSVGDGRPGLLEPLARLADAGHPVVQLRLADPHDLAGEFFRWEFATAVAASILGVNAFDEPNVAESKTNTNEVLKSVQRRGHFESESRRASAREIALLGPPGAEDGAQAEGDEEALVAHLRRWLEQRKAPGYVAIQAYLAPDEATETALQAFRVRVRDLTGAATTLGYGPRFLHSTGQLHKGGPPSGAFLQITAESDAEVPVPDAAYGFATLIRAQALGDARSLAGRNLPLLRLHLGIDADPSTLESWVERLAAPGSAR